MKEKGVSILTLDLQLTSCDAVAVGRDHGFIIYFNVCYTFLFNERVKIMCFSKCDSVLTLTQKHCAVGRKVVLDN